MALEHKVPQLMVGRPQVMDIQSAPESLKAKPAPVANNSITAIPANGSYSNGTQYL